MRKRSANQRALRYSDRSLILLSLPTLLWYLAFCYLPMFGIVIAFKRYRMIPGKGFLYSLFFGSDWVGLENFRFLFLNPQMGIAVRNTLLYNLVFLILGTVLPVVLAIAMSYLRSGRLLTTCRKT
jgi:putative aldouronate transport system permease protein